MLQTTAGVAYLPATAQSVRDLTIRRPTIGAPVQTPTRRTDAGNDRVGWTWREAGGDTSSGRTRFVARVDSSSRRPGRPTSIHFPMAAGRRPTCPQPQIFFKNCAGIRESWRAHSGSAPHRRDAEELEASLRVALDQAQPVPRQAHRGRSRRGCAHAASGAVKLVVRQRAQLAHTLVFHLCALLFLFVAVFRFPEHGRRSGALPSGYTLCSRRFRGHHDVLLVEPAQVRSTGWGRRPPSPAMRSSVTSSPAAAPCWARGSRRSRCR